GLFEVVGFVQPPARPEIAVPVPLVLEGPLPRLARRTSAEVVVVASEDRRGLPVDDLLACRTGGVDVVEDASFAEAALKRIPLVHVRPSSLIFQDGFRAGAVTHALKRAVDVLAAVTMLV